MGAREELIRAYAVFKMSPVFSGDRDFGVEGEKILKRRRNSINSSTPAWNRPFFKGGKELFVSPSSSNIIAKGMYSGKIISSAESGPHINQVYANYRYNDVPDYIKKRYEQYICRYLLERIVFFNKELIGELVDNSQILIGVVNGSVTMAEASRSKPLFDYCCNNIDSINRGILIRVGKKIRSIREASVA